MNVKEVGTGTIVKYKWFEFNMMAYVYLFLISETLLQVIAGIFIMPIKQWVSGLSCIRKVKHTKNWSF